MEVLETIAGETRWHARAIEPLETHSQTHSSSSYSQRPVEIEQRAQLFSPAHLQSIEHVPTLSQWARQLYLTNPPSSQQHPLLLTRMPFSRRPPPPSSSFLKEAAAPHSHSDSLSASLPTSSPPAPYRSSVPLVTPDRPR